MVNSLSDEGKLSGHGTCEDGDIFTLGQLLRTSELDAIVEAAEETGGLQLCGAWDSVMQFFPWGMFWETGCPTEDTIAEAQWGRKTAHFILDKHGGIKQEVRESGAQVHITIAYSNPLVRWPIWPFVSPAPLGYKYTGHMLGRDKEKTELLEKMSATHWEKRFNPKSPTCNEKKPGNATHPSVGCVEFHMIQTMNKKNGIVLTFGQQGNIGTTSNWLTLIIGSLAVISVMTGKLNGMVTGVATKQLKYSGSAFLHRPVAPPPEGTWEMMKVTFPMAAFMFLPGSIWNQVKKLSIMKIVPGRKEIYIWNGYEYGFVDRPQGFNDEDDADGDGIFSIEEQRAAREKKAAALIAAQQDDQKENDDFQNPLKGKDGTAAADAL